MKTLYLIRHAHRDLSDRTLDNGLSLKGVAQAKKIAEWFSSHKIHLPPELISSPKLRCKETLTPLSISSRLPIAIDPDTEEQREHEDSAQFGRRVLHWFENWEQNTAPITLVCSHGDWIPLIISLACGQRVEVSKGSITQIMREGSKAGPGFSVHRLLL